MNSRLRYLIFAVPHLFAIVVSVRVARLRQNIPVRQFGLALFSAAIVCAAASSVFAVDYYWGGDGVNPGGSGTWSQTLDRWGTNPAGPFPFDQNDVGTSTSVNIFEGPSGGAVTVSGTVNVRWLRFNTPGYTLTDGFITRTTSTGFVVDGSEDATIDSDITLPSGSRVFMLGNETLTFNGGNNRGTNVNSGTVIAGPSANIGVTRVLNGGTLVLHSGTASGENLRTSEDVLFAPTFFNGSTLASSNPAGIDIQFVTLENANGTLNFGSAGYTNDIEISASIASGVERTLNVFADTAVTFSGNLSGSGGDYTKDGSGTAVFSGTNTYTGTTLVDAGELIVNGTHTGAGDYNVASGARLGGDGSITLAGASSVTISDSPGAISPGDAGYVPAVSPPSGSHAPSFSYSSGLDPNTVGTFTINGDLDLGGFLLIDLIDPTSADLLTVDGAVTLDDSTSMIEINGLTDLAQLNLAALNFDFGDRIDLLMANEIVGDFENFPFNENVNGVFLGNDGQTIFLQRVPEPSCVTLWIALGMIVAGAAWRKINPR